MKSKAKSTKKSRELEVEWKKLQEKWSSVPKFARKKHAPPSTDLEVKPEPKKKRLPSKVTPGDTSYKKEALRYTGTKMLGVATMHKSNSVPVFQQEDAEAIAKMRR